VLCTTLETLRVSAWHNVGQLCYMTPTAGATGPRQREREAKAMTDRPETITTDQYAALLGVSRWTLYDAAKTDTAPIRPIRVGRAIRWPTAAVLASLGLTELPEVKAAG
jgi:predicted DNA-binding transcriptional regulator AlpA